MISISRILVSCLFLIQSFASSYELSKDLLSIINLYPSSPSSIEIEGGRRKLQFGSDPNNTFVAPLGWMQGLSYYNNYCSGTPFITTNIATGVCVQDGLYSSYNQYVTLDSTSYPTVY